MPYSYFINIGEWPKSLTETGRRQQQSDKKKLPSLVRIAVNLNLVISGHVFMYSYILLTFLVSSSNVPLLWSRCVGARFQISIMAVQESQRGRAAPYMQWTSYFYKVAELL